MQYILQARDEYITLKDGIAYTSKALSKIGRVKKFFYRVINTKDT